MSEFVLSKESAEELKHSSVKAEEEVRKLARESCPRVIYRLREILEDDDPRVAMAAGIALLGYGVGKPRQETIVSGPNGGAIQVQHDHRAVVAELTARRDRVLERQATVFPLTPLPENK